MARSYEERKAAEAARNREHSRSGREIGELPDILDPARKAAGLAALRQFCESYFPHRFSLAWSRDHLRVIDRLEAAVRRGGQFALAMPRGSGKTTLCECTALWAVLGGFRQFVLLIGASRPSANELAASLQGEIETNELLAGDFPEVCFPVAQLEGITNRCAGQLHQGERTHISWRRDELVLPTIPGSKASGAIIRTAGITGRIRGMKFTRPDGKSARPDLVIIDDPQTDKSARSITQCEQRRRIISGAVLGLAGPGAKIAAIMPCTVVRRDDLADEFLDRDRQPEWQGERLKLVYEFPTNKELWDQYHDLRAGELRNGGDGAMATAFYAQHQAEMDAGAAIAWPERKLEDELTGVQHAMNIFLADRERFFSEYQNDPLKDESEEGQLETDAIAQRVNGVARGDVPLESTRLTAYVDVQQRLLYWLVAGWSDTFAGHVIDYGTYPDQGRRYFTLADAQRTLARAAPGTGLEGSIFAGLTKLGELLLTRTWRRQDGADMKVDRLLIDANWGASTDVVYQWCRQTAHAAVVMPSHGRYVGAASKPWSEYQKKPGERMGFHWLVPAVSGRQVRHLLVDTNFWKTFVAQRLVAAQGEKSALWLYGKSGQDHRLLADHFCAEYRTRTEGRGRTVDEWKIRPERNDNHWWDCIVGAAAAASMLGSAMSEASQARGPRKKVKYSEMYAQARQKEKKRGT